MLVDIFGLVPVTCAAPLNYYYSLTLVLSVFLAVFVLLSGGPSLFVAAANAACWKVCALIVRMCVCPASANVCVAFMLLLCVCTCVCSGVAVPAVPPAARAVVLAQSF